MNGQTSTLVHRPAPAPTPSPSVSSSSIHSHDDKHPHQAAGAGHAPASASAATAAAAPPPSTHTATAPTDASHTPSVKKATMTNRLTRMFSHKNVPREGDSHRDSGNSDTEGSVRGNSVSGTQSPHILSRQASAQTHATKVQSTGASSSSTDRRGSAAPANAKCDHNKRFELLADGTHEHRLKSTKRQEKLSNMLREMLGGKKKDDHADDHQQLSLMSTWVDQLRTERDRLATDRKGGPNSTATLVEKYGKCQEVVGRGAFGIVRISHKTDPRDNKTEQLFAVKEFRRRPQESAKKYQKRLTSEFCISSSLRHPNVIHTLDLLQDAKGDYCEIMEFCAGGDLYTLILATGKLEVVEADCYFKQLMCGVEYLHEMGVAHRDLKPENLLLTTHGCLKITDFGNGECFRMAWEKEAHMTAGLCGSAPYIAPEEYVDQEFDPRAVDVWATGVIYMAMRTGRHLWRVAKRDEDEFYERYLEGRKGDDGYGPIETLHRARCRNVIYSILDPDPSPKRRLTATKVLKSEWVRDIRMCRAAEEGF